MEFSVKDQQAFTQVELQDCGPCKNKVAGGPRMAIKPEMLGEASILKVLVLPDEQISVVLSADNTCKVFVFEDSTRTPQLLHTVHNPRDVSFTSVVYETEYERLILGDTMGFILVYALLTEKVVLDYATPGRKPIHALAWADYGEQEDSTRRHLEELQHVLLAGSGGGGGVGGVYMYMTWG